MIYVVENKLIAENVSVPLLIYMINVQDKLSNYLAVFNGKVIVL